MKDFEGTWGIYRADVTSYEGEDGILEHLFDLIGHGGKYCVEFGARDGKAGSNTYNLIQNHGWGGLLIEADPYEGKSLHLNFANNDYVKTLTRTVTVEGNDSLDSILQEVDAPPEPELMVIDIDSIDYLVWESLKKYSPKVVMIEHNDTMPIWLNYFERLHQAIHTGSSLRALCQLAGHKGYEFIYGYKVNAIFVRKDIWQKHEVPSIDLEDLLSKRASHLTPYEGQGCFVAYDGSLVLLNLHERSRLKHKKLEAYAHWNLGEDQLTPLPIRKHNGLYTFIRDLLRMNSSVYVTARGLHASLKNLLK